jgi:hypothetical protein
VVPAIDVRDFGERATHQRAESVNWPADRHQRERRNLLRDAKQRFDFALTADVVGGNDRAEAKTAASEDDILNSRINVSGATTSPIAGRADRQNSAHGDASAEMSGWQMRVLMTVIKAALIGALR